MKHAIRAAVLVLSLALLYMGSMWLMKPHYAAGTLGMPLLDDYARSTQIGDVGAFFLGTGLLVVLGVFTRQQQWFYAAAILVACTALLRTSAWLFHDTPFISEAVGVELVSAVLFVFAGRLLCKTETDR